MKKLYQTKVRCELCIPRDYDEEKFIKEFTANSDRKDLINETNILVSSESEDDAIVDSLCEYLKKAFDIHDYSKVLYRGEVRNRYYVSVVFSVESTGEKLDTRMKIELFPEELGI